MWVYLCEVKCCVTHSHTSNLLKIELAPWYHFRYVFLIKTVCAVTCESNYLSHMAVFILNSTKLFISTAVALVVQLEPIRLPLVATLNVEIELHSLHNSPQTYLLTWFCVLFAGPWRCCSPMSPNRTPGWWVGVVVMYCCTGSCWNRWAISTVVDLLVWRDPQIPLCLRKPPNLV